MKRDLVWRVFVPFPTEAEHRRLSARPLHYLWAPAHLEIKHLLICQKHKHEVLPISLTYKFGRRKNTVAHLIDENGGWWPEPPPRSPPSLPPSLPSFPSPAPTEDGEKGEREVVVGGGREGRTQGHSFPLREDSFREGPPALICAHLSLCSLSP